MHSGGCRGPFPPPTSDDFLFRKNRSPNNLGDSSDCDNAKRRPASGGFAPPTTGPRCGLCPRSIICVRAHNVPPRPASTPPKKIVALNLPVMTKQDCHYYRLYYCKWVTYMPMLIIIRVIWLKIMDECCFIQADEQGEQPGVFNISGAAVNDEPIVSQPIGVSSTAGPEESSAIPMPYHWPTYANVWSTPLIALSLDYRPIYCVETVPSQLHAAPVL